MLLTIQQILHYYNGQENAAKDIEDGGTIFYNEKVKSISKQFKQPYWKVLNKALELQGLPQRAKPDPEAFLQAKGIDTRGVNERNYEALNHYSDIAQNPETDGLPFYEQIAMKKEMLAFYKNGGNAIIAANSLAVNQSPREQIKTMRRLSGLV